MEATALPEAWDAGDDWRGVTSTQERRRRQNRLHQRAHRKKRLARLLAENGISSQPEVSSADALVLHVPDEQHPTAEDRGVVWPMSNLHQLANLLQLFSCSGLSRNPQISQQIRDFVQKAQVNWTLNRPVIRDLPTLTRLNAFDALVRNASILQIPVECLETDDSSSPFSLCTPAWQATPAEFPMHLRPTQLQRAVAHHAWLDLFPFPGLRDGILQGINEGSIDEDRICEELCCDLLNMETDSTALAVIWGDSWDARGWEFSASFFEKYAPLLSGCSK